MNEQIPSTTPRSSTSMWVSGTLLLMLVALVAGAHQIVQWTVNRVYVYEGYSLLLRYKGPPLPFLPGGRDPAQAGQFAKTDTADHPLEIGVLKEMKGPGRHFLWYGVLELAIGLYALAFIAIANSVDHAYTPIARARSKPPKKMRQASGIPFMAARCSVQTSERRIWKP